MPSWKLVNLSNLPWVPKRLKRNQAFFHHLLDGCHWLNEGIYYNPPTIAGPGWRKYVGTSKPSKSVQGSPGGKPIVIVDSSYTLPNWHIELSGRRWARAVAGWLRQEVLQGAEFVLWANTASRLQVQLLEELRADAKQVICDFSDDFWSEGFGMRPRDLQIVCDRSDAVVAVNETVSKRINHSRKIVVRNGTSPDAFLDPDRSFVLPPILPKAPSSTYVGFTGGLNTVRVDRNLLAYLFNRFPSYTFVFVGYINAPELQSWLLSFPNARFVAEVPHDVLKHVIHSFDVAIVPHLVNSHTEGNDLLKVLDYLACGVPVVSTRCSNAEQYGATVCIADDAGQFGDAVESFVLTRQEHDSSAGIELVRSRSWRRLSAYLAGQLGWSAEATPDSPSLRTAGPYHD